MQLLAGGGACNHDVAKGGFGEQADLLAMLNQNRFGFVILHGLRCLQNRIGTLQPRRIVAVGIAHAGGNQTFHFLRVLIARHTGEFIGYAGIKIRTEARIGFHQLGDGRFWNGVDQRLLLHNETVCAVSFHQGARFKRILRVVQANHFVADAHLAYQTFDNHIQKFNRLIGLDDHILIVEKRDVNGRLQFGALGTV